MKAREIARVFETIAPLDSGIPGDELGFVHGNPDVEVGRLGCVWCIDTRSAARCAELDIDMIICHERVTVPHQRSPWYDGPGEDDIYSNRKRMEILDQRKIVVYRSHSNWDAKPGTGVADSAVDALGIPGLRRIAEQKFFSVQELPEPVSVMDFRDTVASALGFPACRIFGDGSSRFTKFAFLIGGFGENQIHIPQAALELGAELIIMGEMSEFIVLTCLEMGLPVIETLHSASEAPGIRNQAMVLKERLPEIEVQYVPSGAAVWQS